MSERIRWTDRDTGFECLALFQAEIGFWCGYVAVEKPHPWHGVWYGGCLEGCEREPEDSEMFSREHPSCGSSSEHSPEGRTDVHGGLTFSGVPHGEPDDGRWWFGFDCGHAGDLVTSFPRFGEVYRDLDFVRGECAKLAKQLALVVG